MTSVLYNVRFFSRQRRGALGCLYNLCILSGETAEDLIRTLEPGTLDQEDAHLS